MADQRDKDRGHLSALQMAIGLILMYAGFIAVLIVDELVLGTRWFIQYMPSWACEVARFLCLPVRWIVGRL